VGLEMSDEFLLPMTSAVDFLSLVASVWLGLYMITRGPRNKVSWLTLGTLWSLAGSFLNILIIIHVPPASGELPWWWGWSLTIAAAFWFDLSTSLLPPLQARKRHWSVIVVYFVAINLLAMQTYTKLIYGETTFDLLLSYQSLKTGDLYPVYGISLIVVMVLSLYNLWKARWISKASFLQKPFNLLLIANGLSILAILYEFLSTQYRWIAPMWPGELCLGLSAILLGYSVVYMNAINEGRVIGRDFSFGSIAMGMVVGLYLLAAYFSRVTLGVPFIAFIFIILLAIFSHSLIDWGRGRLEKFIYRSHTYPHLRGELREFSRTTSSEHDVQERIRTLLKSLCRNLKTNSGIVALRDGDTFTPLVNWKGEGLIHFLNSDDLITDEIRQLLPNDYAKGQVQVSIVVPLVAGGEQIGALILGNGLSLRTFTEEDFILLEDFVDIVAWVIYSNQIQEKNLEQIQGLMKEVQASERVLKNRMKEVFTVDELHPFLNVKTEDEAIQLVEDALRHLHDYSFLGTHPLSELNVVGEHLRIESGHAITHLDRGKALQSLLVAVIDKLKPYSPRPKPPSKEWYPFIILHDCYIEEELNRDVMGSLFIGEGTFNRTRRRAIRAITKVMAELEGRWAKQM
jgi:hypothetical protein